MVKTNNHKGRGRPAYDDILTPAEWRVVHLIQHGLTNREIAKRLGISIDGVKYHVANLLSKLELPNKSALLDWFAAPQGSAMELAMLENTTPNKTIHGLTHLGQVSRTVSDLEKSVAFYRDTLQTPHLYTFGNLAFFDLEGTRLLLNQSDTLNAEESILYFSVFDMAATIKRLSEKGIKVTHQAHKIHTHADGTEEWMAFIEDPDGRPLGLMCSVSPAQQ